MKRDPEMAVLLAPIRSYVEGLERENAELHAEVRRLARENNEQCDAIHELRAMVERSHAAE